VNGTKPLIFSRSFIGGLVQVAGVAIYYVFGTEIDAETQIEITNATMEVVSAGTVLAGLLLTTWGTMTRSKKVTGIFKVKE
jgi:hypothetical protein